MSAADLIRRAAKALREHADGAAAGNWAARADYPHGVLSQERPFDEYPESWFISTTLAEKPDGDAAYIALMHPPVALALAAVLDEYAAAFDVVPDEAVATTMYDAELTLARAILREVDHG